MKILVCGGRDYFDQEKVYGVLYKLDDIYNIKCVVHGGADGVDSLAGKWARLNGIEERPYPADWKTNGKAAGPIRNALMLQKERPELVVAFPGGQGTLDMINKAKARKIRVIEV